MKGRKIAFASAEQSDQDEHNLVSRIRQSDVFIPDLSLVAANRDNNEILGYILLSKVLIGNGDQSKSGVIGTCIYSVLPDQNKGTGNSLEKAKERGFHSVIVL